MDHTTIKHIDPHFVACHTGLQVVTKVPTLNVIIPNQAALDFLDSLNQPHVAAKSFIILYCKV